MKVFIFEPNYGNSFKGLKRREKDWNEEKAWGRRR
jgi:hypothetical protein